MVTILLGLALLAPATALGQDLFVCSMDGRISADCCCPAEELANPELPVTSSIQRICCTVESPTIAAPPPVRLEAQPLPRASVALAVPAASLPPSSLTPVAVAGPRQSRAPPAPAVPLFVRLCSFLI